MQLLHADDFNSNNAMTAILLLKNSQSHMCKLIVNFICFTMINQRQELEENMDMLLLQFQFYKEPNFDVAR